MEAGELEILTFLPPGLLKKSIADMNMDEFLESLAKARFVRNILESVIRNGVVGAFGNGEEE